MSCNISVNFDILYSFSEIHSVAFRKLQFAFSTLQRITLILLVHPVYTCTGKTRLMRARIRFDVADYFVPDRSARYCDERVCMWVCLSLPVSVRSHSSKTSCPGQPAACRVNRHQKGCTILDFNEAICDRVAVASAGPYANHLHLAPDR